MPPEADQSVDSQAVIDELLEMNQRLSLDLAIARALLKKAQGQHDRTAS